MEIQVRVPFMNEYHAWVRQQSFSCCFLFFIDEFYKNVFNHDEGSEIEENRYFGLGKQ